MSKRGCGTLGIGKPNKRAKFKASLGLKNVTDAALSAVMAALEKQGDGESVSQATLSRMYLEEYRRVGWTIKLPYEDGSEDFDWAVCKPDSLIQYFIDEAGASFSNLLASTLDQCGTKKLNLVFSADEITPGNSHRPENFRKIWAIFFSFREFGNALFKEEVWMPVAVLRSSVSKDLAGQISHAFGRLLRMFFVEPCQFSDAGFTLVLDRPRLVRAEFGNLAADGDANRAIWAFLGANAVKPCMECKNVLKLNHPALKNQSYLVDVGCTQMSKFDRASNEDIWKAFDDLEEAKPVLNPTQFDKLEKASGLKWSSSYLLAMKEIRKYVKPADAVTVDPMHDAVSNGFVNAELFCFTSRCRSVCNIRFKHFKCHCTADWQLPAGSETKKIAHIFSDSREEASKEKFRSDASETLLIFPLVLNFAEDFVQKDLKILEKEVAYLQACGRLLDSLLMVKRGNPANLTPRTYAKAWEEYMEAHQKAYGKEFLTTKFHWGSHHTTQWERDGIALDCWTGERKNKALKIIAEHSANTSVFERTVVTRTVVNQVRLLKESSFHSSLLKPVTTCKALEEAFGVQRCFVARSMRYHGAIYTVGDVICLGNCEFGKVRACCEADDDMALVIDQLERLERVSRSCSICREVGRAVVKMAERRVYTAYAWTRVQQGLLVLHTSLM